MVMCPIKSEFICLLRIVKNSVMCQIPNAALGRIMMRRCLSLIITEIYLWESPCSAVTLIYGDFLKRLVNQRKIWSCITHLRAVVIPKFLKRIFNRLGTLAI